MLSAFDETTNKLITVSALRFEIRPPPAAYNVA
jgi:hypothetical protein